MSKEHEANCTVRCVKGNSVWSRDMSSGTQLLKVADVGIKLQIDRGGREAFKFKRYFHVGSR